MLRLRPRHGSYALAAALFLGAASAADAQSARYNHSMTLMADGNILIVGGKGAADTSVATVDIYISTGAKYETRASMNTARSSHTATLLPDGRILVTGGVNAAGTYLDTGELFDPRLNTWTTVPNTNFGGPRVNHTATILPSGRVLIVGGQTDATGTVLASCSLFYSGVFNPCGTGLPMQMARAGHTATLLHNGRVFVAGGYRATGNGFAVTTEKYDPGTDSWTAGPALLQARAYHTATQMGNQRVLIAGGYNAINFLQSLGFLGSTEIYDPNSDTITPAAPLASRKMHQTAILSGVGKTHLYGGLGNITTSYLRGPLPVSGQVFITSTSLTRGTLRSNPPTDISGNPSFNLSAAVSGRIVDGDVDFSSPTIAGADFKIDFSYPGLLMNLDGIPVDRGAIDLTASLGPVGGVIAFAPQSVSSVDMDPTAAGSQVTMAAPAQPNVSTNLTGGTLTGQIHIPMAASNLGGTVLAGNAVITAGQITKPSTDFVNGEGYTVSLTGGSGSLVGGTVALDSDGVPALIMNVTFTNLAGTITNSTSTAIASPVDISAQKVTGFTLRVSYVVSPITLNKIDHSFNFDIATVAVRVMQFSDNEAYTPSANRWDLGQTAFPTFNHTHMLLPNSDEYIYGGRACTTPAACGTFTYSATNRYTAYIQVQQDESPWETVGSLATPRANHTLTVLPDGRVLAAGGENASNTIFQTELYIPETRAWVPGLPMKQHRSHHTATLLPNGNVLAAGGFTGLNHSTGTSSFAEIFYPDSNAWVPTAPMISSRAYHAAVLLPEGHPFMIGGFANGAYLTATEVFFSTSHKWAAGPPLPEPRAQFTATVLQDGRILVVGGVNAASGVLGTTRIFNPQTWSWAAGPSINFPRYSHTATMLRDGRVLIVGGSDGVREMRLAEVFDPATNAWTMTSQFTPFGNDLGGPRLGHTATLLPDGKVLFVGGFTAFEGPLGSAEGFDADFSTFQVQGKLTTPKGDHTTVMLRDGYILHAGGFTGLSYLGETQILYFGGAPDSATLAGGQRRRPTISAMSASLIQPGSNGTLFGTGLRGTTEASGGGAGSGNSHHAHPRVYLQRADSASSSANDSGWMIDVTSGIFYSGVNAWSNMDSSVTFQIPSTTATLPLGWYHLRVAANSQFSESRTFQVGPPKPAGSPGIPVGTLVGASSVIWTWAAAGGNFDGYSVYSATSGIFIATVPRSGGGQESFLESQLGPDTSSLIKIAAYNITGDGAVVAATVPVNTAVSSLAGLQGVAVSPQSIFWSWNPVGGAATYEVFSASSGIKIGTPGSNAFTQVGLSTNTPNSVLVRAIMTGGPGSLTASASVYTLAAVPTPNSPPIHTVSTGGLIASWLPNTNPTGTKYQLDFTTDRASNTISIPDIDGLNFNFANAIIQIIDQQSGVVVGSSSIQNVIINVTVAAVNGDGVKSAFVSLGSSNTLAAPPADPRVIDATPSSLTVKWDANQNNSSTTYKVVYSSDNFVTDFSTAISFGDAFNSHQTTIGNLLTGKTYSIRISARNSYGAETAFVSTQGFTDNGGGPVGSLSILAPTTVYTALSGTLGSGRRFEIRIPAGTFDQDTRIFVTSRAIGDLRCGNIPVGFSITNQPAVQPRLPVEVGIQYALTDAGLGSLTTLGMVRYDPVSGACVPMEARVDAANSIVYARLNHFSDFQLQQLVPGGAAGTARVFPNPLYTRTQGFFTFDHIPAGAHVRVYTIHGEEVFDQAANASGIVTWRAENKVGRPVASGLYLAVIESGGEKKIMKLAVVR